MSGAFKKALIIGAIGAVLGVILNAVLGGGDVMGYISAALLFFAIFVVIGYIIGRLTTRKSDDEYEYEDEDA